MRKELLLPEMVQLMEHYPTTIKRFGMRKFCSAAFYLMVKLSSGHKSEGDTRTVKRSGSGGEQA
ncbi:hypothetical protein DPMN_019256 [Dreissena polymorpha]|uniref:Uncharacterized protein n=1 Tax=Dreissena polymorpha TaxID=45954 RepID=A0A9D4S816_DREPO|nr:hypothetical protein DPMN_019256 [Dreissena polymorpha]